MTILRWCSVCSANVETVDGGDCPSGFCGGTYPPRTLYDLNNVLARLQALEEQLARIEARQVPIDHLRFK